MPPSGFSEHDMQPLDNFLLGCFQRVLDEHEDVRTGLITERRHIAAALASDLNELGGNPYITRATLEALDAFYEEVAKLPDEVLYDRNVFEAVVETLNGRPLAGLLSLHVTLDGKIEKRAPEATT